ncbi:ABC-type transport auxiliary lipoprotein family protein [Dongia soli]|uniref:ABC-type transport auxiliary lipoprotein family protein n=1 Tax=Dongia soli TaxID=600628 RepID=A0ABU5EEV1_9PROT|nr:ABC-type transport auxiliary lipoprotein family protein [Dongia soli]MDY0883998.1 ABC-type transport auxiliary lipoprotein family protein [Dongia soli]
MPRHLLILSVLTLVGCAAPEVPKEQYFRLIATPAETPVAKPLKGIVEVPPFDAEGVLAERPLLFTADGGRKLEQRNYAYWTNSPPQMLRDQLVTYLRSAQIAKEVVPSELRVDAKYVVRGKLRRLEQTANPDGGVIEIEVALLDEDTNRLIASKVFLAKEPATSGDIDDAVAALNTGMNQIFREIAGMISRPHS